MMRRWKRELSVAAALGLLLLVLAILRPAFYSGANLRAILVKDAPELVAAIGITTIILARHIDISLGAQFSICGVLAASMGKAGLAAPLVALITLAAGAGLGAVNGALVAGLGLPSIVVTLATMVTWSESLRWITEGQAVQNLPDGFQWLGMGQAGGQVFVVVCALALFAFFAWALRSLPAGRAIYAVGSDAEAARLAGIRPGRVVFGVFVLAGVLTALAALLTAIQFRGMQPNAGEGLELKVIAAAVVGGVAISGGRGRLAGTLLGVLLLGAIGPALEFFKLPAYWEKALQGAIILIAVASDAINLRQRKHVGSGLAAS
jgi:rhamnose transport system permease protein